MESGVGSRQYAVGSRRVAGCGLRGKKFGAGCWVLGAGFVLLMVAGYSCNNNSTGNSESKKKGKVVEVQVPGFSADSAYHFIEKQLEFGPREVCGLAGG